ncbi:complex I subunit 4 family protein [Solitalea lacus]|uniref:complex I subunit 4 family protein n=1 Tax=Solitalea lacus TaxID=2911172 RepID=UPI001EDBDC4C|nr:NADH-quinone oxidoreductase subunit M [Solitalea lacus]UKJ07171.1 NADH-quinone oxidoreductase subunit M [Solitalea lacus]
MILCWLIGVLLLGGMLAWLIGYFTPSLAKWIALLSTLITLLICVSLWIDYYPIEPTSASSNWLIEFVSSWIPSLGVQFHFGLDGLNLIMLLLTSVLGLMAVICSWNEISIKQNFFYFNLQWVLAGIMGVFLALDLFLFYFFWEMMLIPMYFLISIWGSEKRIYSSYKFFLYTQASGLLMLMAILSLYFVNGGQTGLYTFDYQHLVNSAVVSPYAIYIALGFFIAFTVKLPMFPFHTWLPDAHAEAPTAGSVILAGLMLKTGAYGLIRFVITLFPAASVQISSWGMILGVISILYGALQAFGQTDLKRMVAYTSVSHMGFIIIGIFSFNQLAMQGVVLQIITHGISTAALFILAGQLKERLHTRDMNHMGGLWALAPQMGSSALLFAMAACGLPALGNFIAEFLILLGTFQNHPLITILSSIGLILSAIYAVRLMQKVFFGPLDPSTHNLQDFTWREKLIMTLLTVAIIFIGLYPQPVITMLNNSIAKSLSKKEIIPINSKTEPRAAMPERKN